MTHFRPYRNSDTPALAALWNRAAPASAAARPLSKHEFDRHVVGGVISDAAGLIVAVRDGKPVGFAHAGFGPDDLAARPLQLSTTLGTVAMLLVEPQLAGEESATLAAQLLNAAEAYLRERGATVVYAGGQLPLNPYYWGIYGGSEYAGVLDDHIVFAAAARASGYEAVSATVLLEADLALPEPFDPRGVMIRRQTQVAVEDDPLPSSWWQALALSDFHLATHRLITRNDGTELAHATTWDMSWFSRADGGARLGLVDMEVNPRFRRKGYGRHLVNEILRFARAHSIESVSVQTRATNTAAQALYHATGFQPVQSATLYRKPG